MIGGIIAGAIGQGAKDVSDIAQGQIDVNNKQQLATFQSQLETERAEQAARLAQTIGQENTMFNLSPGVTAAKNVAASSATRAAAATSIEPDVLAASDTLEAHKPKELGPGQQLFQNGKPIASNTNPTQADAWMAGMHTAGKGGAANNFPAKEIDDGLSSLTGLIEKGFTDPATTKTPPALTNIGSSAYMGYIKNGASPAEARANALSDTTNAYQSAMAVMQSEKYKDVVKGDINAALAIAQQLRQPAPAPAAPAAGGTPPKKGLVDSARAPDAAAAPATPDSDEPIPNIALARGKRQTGPHSAPAPKVDRTADAQAAFAKVGSDPRAAFELQGSDLFDSLAADQQAAIAKLVNGR